MPESSSALTKQVTRPGARMKGTLVTSRRFLQLVRRFWFVVAVGMAVAALLALRTTPETVYWAKQSVTVVQPAKPKTPKTLEDLPSTAVPAASVLMQAVNNNQNSPRSNAADATLFGEGKRDAVSARLRDVGGQWGSVIPNPIIDIQVVGPTPSGVSAQLSSETDRIAGALATLQQRLQVAPAQQLVLQPPQVAPSVVEVSGSRTRARAATVAIVLLITGALLVVVERLPTRGPHGSRRTQRAL